MRRIPAQVLEGPGGVLLEAVTALAASFFWVQRPQASFSNGLAWVP